MDLTLLLLIASVFMLGFASGAMFVLAKLSRS